MTTRVLSQRSSMVGLSPFHYLIFMNAERIFLCWKQLTFALPGVFEHFLSPTTNPLPPPLWISKVTGCSLCSPHYKPVRLLGVPFVSPSLYFSLFFGSMKFLFWSRDRRTSLSLHFVQSEASFHCPAEHMQLVIWDLLKADPVINKAEQKACC